MKGVAKKLALGWLTVGGSDPFGWLAGAKAGGFGSLGVKVAPRPGEPLPELAADVDLRSRFLAECRASGVSLLNMGSLWLDGQVQPADYAYALDIGAAMGAPYVVGISVDPDPQRREAHLVELARMARERGMRLTLEFFAYSAVPSFNDALALARQHEDIGILFDALHFHRSGGQLEEMTAENVGYIDYFQLCDAPAQLPVGMTLSEEGREARLFPGKGDIPLRGMMARLPTSMRVEVEIPHRDLAGSPPDVCGITAMSRTLAFLATADQPA